MDSLRTGSRLPLAAALALGMLAGSLASATAAQADPDATAAADDVAVEAPEVPAVPAAAAPTVPEVVPVDAPTNTPSSDACKQFSVALNFAAANYEDFAYNTAGTGNVVNYQDPNVASSNVVGRTALRQAAANAMDAANTPGLEREISSPMHAWSARATKLVLLMGLRRGGDSLNTTADNMNTDAYNVQMACAAAGTAV